MTALVLPGFYRAQRFLTLFWYTRTSACAIALMMQVAKDPTWLRKRVNLDIKDLNGSVKYCFQYLHFACLYVN